MDITPLIIAFVFYIAPIVFVIWFMVSVVSALRERNELLKEISKKLDKRSS